MEIRYANHPDDSKHYTTEELRKHYLVEQVFKADEVNFTYSHYDRIIFGGVMPIKKKLSLAAGKELGVSYFLERREMGVINIGGSGIITLDGVQYRLDNKDGLYVGMGTKEVQFESVDGKNPAKFYVNSAPAHITYPTVKIGLDKANKVHLGSKLTSNERTINQYVHPKVCKSNQLVMGMTALDPGCVWNTMPCHTHERRMEVYLYFNLPEDAKVIHLMGQPGETRHIVMGNDQAVISPSWSIHSGVGTSNYTFIWGMVGENQEFDDMDFVKMDDLK